MPDIPLPLNFESLAEQISEEYDDDARYSLNRDGSTLYLQYSDHHNGQLYVVVLQESDELYQAIEARIEEGAFWATKEEMLRLGGKLIGED